MKKFIFTVLFLLPICSWAADDYVFVSPQRLSLNEFNKTGRLHIVNKSDSQKKYQLKLVNYEMQSDGSLKKVDDFKYSAKNILIYSPKTITLKGNEDNYVDVRAVFPPSLIEGEHHVHMVFEELNNQGELSSVPIFVRKGLEKTNVELKSGRINGSDNTLSLTFLKTEGFSKEGILNLYSITESGTSLIGTPIRISFYSEVERVEQKFNIPSDVVKVEAVLTDMTNNVINSLEITK